jgi:hypothetical protein
MLTLLSSYVIQGTRIQEAHEDNTMEIDVDMTSNTLLREHSTRQWTPFPISTPSRALPARALLQGQSVRLHRQDPYT